MYAPSLYSLRLEDNNRQFTDLYVFDDNCIHDLSRYVEPHAASSQLCRTRTAAQKHAHNIGSESSVHGNEHLG